MTYHKSKALFLIFLFTASLMVAVYSLLNITTATAVAAPTADSCFIETTGDNTTDYQSADASALQTAVNDVSDNTTIKIAGTCAGVQQIAGITQTVYISKSLTLQGGYTTTNWIVSNPDTTPTTLSAEGLGRVIFITSTAAVNIENLIVISGTADAGGGIYNNASLSLSGVDILSNTTQSSTGDGGGFFNDSQGVANISQSTIAYNQARYGGGIENQGNLNISQSSIIHNTASADGGGLSNWGTMTMVRSTIAQNTASDDGGGMLNINSAMLIASTLSSNTANGNNHNVGGGGILQYVDENLPSLRLINTTLTGNSHTSAGGDGINLIEGTASLVNSIISANGTQNCGMQGSSSFISGGYNLEDTNTCNLTATGDLVNTDPQLGPLADNGGSTQTHLLLVDSPAIDAGDDVICDDNPTGQTDQRGVSRPQGAQCDIGAVEARTLTLTVSTTGIGSGSISGSGINCGVDCTETYHEQTPITLTAAADTGSVFTGWSGACTNSSGACVVKMNQTQSVTATFSVEYQIYLPMVIKP